MVNRKENNFAGTVVMVIIMYVGLTMALFYGIKEEWDAVLFSLLAAFVAFTCKKKRDKSA